MLLQVGFNIDAPRAARFHFTSWTGGSAKIYRPSCHGLGVY